MWKKLPSTPWANRRPSPSSRATSGTSTSDQSTRSADCHGLNQSSGAAMSRSTTPLFYPSFLAPTTKILQSSSNVAIISKTFHESNGFPLFSRNSVKTPANGTAKVPHSLSHTTTPRLFILMNLAAKQEEHVVPSLTEQDLVTLSRTFVNSEFIVHCSFNPPTTLAALIAGVTDYETKVKHLGTFTTRNNCCNLPQCRYYPEQHYYRDCPELRRHRCPAAEDDNQETQEERPRKPTTIKLYRVKKTKKLSYWKGEYSNFQRHPHLLGITRTTTSYRIDKDHS